MMEKLKKHVAAAIRLFAPVGVAIAALIGLVGGVQALVGFSPLGEKWLLAALIIFLVCGAILLIQHEVIIREAERGLGNEHAKALWREGIPAVQSEYLSRVRQGDYTVVARFWSAGIVDVGDGFGYDLHVACEVGHAAIVQGILERGGDPKRTNHRGMTPLMIAVGYGHAKVVDVLLHHDCAINARGTDGGYSALFIAAVQGHVPLIETLLREGADVDAVDYNNLTPLMGAMTQGKWTAVDALLAARSSLTRRDASGATLVDYAAFSFAPQSLVERLEGAGIRAASPNLEPAGGGYIWPAKLDIRWHESADVPIPDEPPPAPD